MRRPHKPRRSGWRPWFAWRPVVIGSEWVWLELVERREVYVACHPCGEYESQYRLRAVIAKAGGAT